MEKVKKVTKVEYFGMVRAIVEDADVENKEDILAFVDNEVAKLKNKKHTETKTQKENVELAEVVYGTMVELGKAATVTEIFNAIADERIKSAPKVTALLKKLGDRVVRTVEGKKALYSIAD